MVSIRRNGATQNYSEFMFLNDFLKLASYK